MSQDIVEIIYESIDPVTWYEAGGEGTIRPYGDPPRSLIIKQTPANHQLIEQLLKDLRDALNLGNQVAIEARFLTVSEEFLEAVGLDVDFRFNNPGGKWGVIDFQQGHSGAASSAITSGGGNIAAAITGNYGAIIDDLQAAFLIEATQSREDSRSLTAPRVAVLNNERASITVQTERDYIADWEFEDITVAGEGQPVRTIADPQPDTIFDGVVLTVTPLIMPDKKHVLLRVTTWFTKSDFSEFDIPSPLAEPYKIQLPTLEVADIKTRVHVPDGGTLLIGGQKISRDQKWEEGVPVLAKVPVFGRLFRNRGKFKDHEILLILIKPRIMLSKEVEAEATGSLEAGI
jgi:type II secretory pathway component GspD/PulD (secretin)